MANDPSLNIWIGALVEVVFFVMAITFIWWICGHVFEEDKEDE